MQVRMMNQPFIDTPSLLFFFPTPNPMVRCAGCCSRGVVPPFRLFVIIQTDRCAVIDCRYPGAKVAWERLVRLQGRKG